MSDPTKVNKKATVNLEELLKKDAPYLVEDGKVNIDKLKGLLTGKTTEKEDDRFYFNWAGKDKVFQSIQAPAYSTLVPQKDRSIGWDDTDNLMIVGENLETLKLLLKPYFGKVKVIYIDVPYNTGKDFIYKDNFASPLSDYLVKTGQKDSNGVGLTTNTETNGRFHSAWLNSMYPRLFMARNLLKENGLICVSIDDNEVHHLRMIMDDIFGEDNFVDCLIWKKRYGGGSKEKHFVTLHEYILVYAKDIQAIEEITVPISEETIQRYYKMRDENYEKRGPFRTHPLEATKSMGDRPNLVFPIKAPDGSEINPKRQWLWSKETVEDAIKHSELYFFQVDGIWNVHTKQYLKDRDGNVRPAKLQSVIDDVYTQHGTNEIIDIFGNAQIFPFPKPSELIKKLVVAHTQGADIVLDFLQALARLDKRCMS